MNVAANLAQRSREEKRAGFTQVLGQAPEISDERCSEGLLHGADPASRERYAGQAPASPERYAGHGEAATSRAVLSHVY
jgi:hypothetical protein